MKGKIIKTSAKLGVFVQVDKNSQICDLYRYDMNFLKEERVRERIRGKLYDTYKGRPLYNNWNNLIEDVIKDYEKEKKIIQ